MTELSYESAPFAVRGDLTAAHRRAWRRLSHPGTWWTGHQRVAIAAETRKAQSCSLCRERRAAVSPFAIEGEHDSLGTLSEPIVDVIHRIGTDPGRLTQSWYQQVLTSGVSDAAYVEIVSVVATVVAVDTFARGIGIPAPALPDPVGGEPSRTRPASAKLDVAWVPMIGAEGPEADLYGSGTLIPNIGRALSLVPGEARAFFDLSTAHYFSLNELMDVTKGRAISRPQIELIAARVSALNQCFY